MEKLVRRVTNKGSEMSLSAGEKRLWQRPNLAFIGKLGDLVKGHGKSGGNEDSDPFGTLKPGVG